QELLPVGYSELRFRAVEVVPGVGLRRHVPRGGRACSVGRAPVRCAGSGPFHQLELTRTVSRFLAVNCPMGGPRTSRLTRRTPWPVTHCDATVAKSSAVLVPPPTLSTRVRGPAPADDPGGTAVRVRPAVWTARGRPWWAGAGCGRRRPAALPATTVFSVRDCGSCSASSPLPGWPGGSVSRTVTPPPSPVSRPV